MLYRAAEHVPGGSVTTLNISSGPSGADAGLAGFDQIERPLLARFAELEPVFRLGFVLLGGVFAAAWLAALLRIGVFGGATEPFYLLAASLASIGLAGSTRSLARTARTAAGRFEKEADERQKRERRVLIERVRRDWIDSVLEQSPYRAARAELGLTSLPEVIERSLDVTVESPSSGKQTLPADTPIAEIFDRAERFLLILGEPGTGKTMLLLELAEELLDRAKRDETCPVPVVFNLSSWVADDTPLWEWLISELGVHYDVPKETAESWIFNDTLMPLLDGLDELDEESRPYCLQKINLYRGVQTLWPVVVCSRSEQYRAAEVELRTGGAVTVNPLDPRSVESCLNLAGPRLAGVKAALELEPELRELVSKPLMLSLLLAAPSAANAGAASGSSTATYDSVSKGVLAAYVDAMLAGHDEGLSTDQESTLNWLSWLASAMRREQHTVFHLEKLALEWLPRRDRQIARRVEVLIPGLYCMLFCALIGAWTGYGPFGVVIWGLGGFLIGSAQAFDQTSWSDGRQPPGDRPDAPTEFSADSGPNMGIRRSARRALWGGIWGLLMVALLIGLPWVQANTMSRDSQALATDWQDITATEVAVLAALTLVWQALLSGGLFYLRHYVVRALLWRRRLAPWDYVGFLDYAHERLLLRKVGGGYVFIHRRLLDYFADLYEDSRGADTSRNISPSTSANTS